MQAEPRLGPSREQLAVYASGLETGETAEMRRAISVMKQRRRQHGAMMANAEGIRVGEPLRQFARIVTGARRSVGRARDLLVDRGD